MTVHKILYVTLFTAGTVWCPAVAQSTHTETKNENSNVVEKIEMESNGNVTIDLPTRMLDQLMKEDEHKTQSTGQAPLKPGVNKMSGFRVQVFSDGHNQTSLEARAKARGNAVVAKFPKYRGQIYSHSSAPNWYTRVGNFRTQAEASAALAELKRAFPQFASEMRVVKSQIVIIKQ